MKLYEINKNIYDCMDIETGEVLDVERLEKLSIARDTKIENVALYCKSTKAEAKAIDDEIKILQARKKTLINRCKNLKEYLVNALQGVKFFTPKVAIGYRKSTVVEIEDVFKLEENFIKYKEPEADKTAIKNILTSGGEVVGARLVENTSISIK